MQGISNHIIEQQAHTPVLRLRGGSVAPASLRKTAVGVCTVDGSTWAVGEQISMNQYFVDHDPGGSDG